MSGPVTGRVHSIQSLGAVDGPGVRFVVFLQGCPLRCGCCHNPDTWDPAAGRAYTPQQLVERAQRYREYFGQTGGITLSGGEPLLQVEFAREVFALCRQAGIHTCLDTSGCVLDDRVRSLLAVTDRVLLDMKYTRPELYTQHVGCTMEAVLDFLACVDALRIPVTLRQVILPTLNDRVEDVRRLAALGRRYACVDGVELLPFRKVCQVKYDAMGLHFPFGHLPEPTAEQMRQLERELNECPIPV